MVEYHGWITLSDSSVDGDDALTADIYNKVKSEIEHLAGTHREVGIKVMNSIPMVWLCGCTNHRSRDIEDVFTLFRFVGQWASGSYGLLYIWDDEDLRHENEFRVWTLAKGSMMERDDPLLSPCIPTIEDPDPGKQKDEPKRVRTVLK
jgi:hypothetical protein